MILDSIRKYITDSNEKYADILIKHLEGEEVIRFLLFIPYKYIFYKKGLIDEEYLNSIPIIHGKVIKIFKKNFVTVLTVVDLKHPQEKKFCVYFKSKKNINLKLQDNYYFIGKISLHNNQFFMFYPRYQSKEFAVNIDPVYEKVNGCSQQKIHEIIKNIVIQLPHLYAFNTMEIFFFQQSIKKMFESIHVVYNFIDKTSLDNSISILKVCEYICFFHNFNKLQSKRIGVEKKLKYKFDLPLKLTDCQIKAIKGISADLESPDATISFIQGDVGCGKTLVAFCGAVKTLSNSYNVCFMSPTVILSRQHYNNFKKIFPNHQCFFIESSSNKNKNYNNELNNVIESNIPTIFFGTHSLLHCLLKNIGLVIIDEQHKFGMNQRKILIDNYPSSDVIFLSATPIPRTLFMLENNQMKLYTIQHGPFKKNITTKLIFHKEKILDYIIKLSKTEKILWINSSIESYEYNDIYKVGAKERYEFLKSIGGNVSIITGTMGDEEKNNVLNNFNNGILVATICVETGIDIDNLKTIVIERAGDFGLSTLHQLRGRIGRKGETSNCILIEDKNFDRLSILLETNDGFAIAKEDLEQRGYGSFFQKQQWGFDSFKTGILDKKLFKICSKIVQNKEYNESIIEDMSNFFLKIKDVNF